MEPVWLKNYQEGVPATIDPDQYTSLNELFIDAFSKFKDLPAFTNMGQVLTYDEVDQQSKNFAAFIQNNLKMAKGERFAIMMPNLIQYPVALFGILRAGCIAVNVNPLYTAEEFEHQVCDAQATGLIVLENFAHVVSTAIAKTNIKHVVVAKISDVFPTPKSYLVNFIIKYVKRMVPSWKLPAFYWYKDVLKQGAQSKYVDPKVTGQDVAFLQYTGGTTGVPKGAMLTHRNMVANTLQGAAWMAKTLVPRKEMIITALPLYHIFSLTVNCFIFFNVGALNVLITNPRDTKAFIKDLKKHKFTLITGVNTLFNLLLNTKGFDTINFDSLKLALGGGMAVQKVVANRWQEVTKKPLLQGYGLTETSPAACMEPLNFECFKESIGLPLPSTEVTIRDDKGQELDFDQPGELWIRGPQVMLGYWNQVSETKNVLDAEGWLHSGDIATISSEGFVKIVDRKKDLILVSGFKIFPNEVEDIIAAMPGVREVAIVGAPDPISGEKVKAFVVKNNPKITAEDVRAYCHEHLTGYKVPKEVEFRDTLPKNNVGKILRRELR
jgi:long-chain acyl-CoA synthetase